MLVDYRLGEPRDTAAFTGLLITFSEALSRDKNITVAVYRMRPGAGGVRRVSDEGTLNDGFQQGRTRLVGGGIAYPGDAFFKSSNKLTIQLHHYDLLTKDTQIIATAAPLLAIHIPRALAKEWLVQLQAGQATS
jgi:hypothetical protein